MADSLDGAAEVLSFVLRPLLILLFLPRLSSGLLLLLLPLPLLAPLPLLPPLLPLPLL